MAKLPEHFTAETVNSKTYTYDSAIELVDDMKRLRRKLGWWFDAYYTDPHYRFVGQNGAIVDQAEEDGEDVPFGSVVFLIRLRIIHQNLWASTNPGREEEALVLRRQLLTERTGVYKVTNAVNAIVPDPVVASTRLDALLDDEDL